jgi:hypothetical protein
MPSGIKGYLVHGFIIGQVMCLLENQCSRCWVQFFGRVPETMGKERNQVADRKFSQEIYLKETDPELIQELAAFRAKKSPL